MRTLVATLAVVAAMGCQEEPLGSLDTQAIVRGEQAPDAGFDVADDGTWVSPGTLEGFAVDADQAASTLVVEVVSAADGTLFYGNPEADGSWSWTGELSPGDNPVQVTVVDREGMLTSKSTLLKVRPNAVPTCTILSPIAEQTFRPRTDIRFEARVNDADGDPLDVLWRSNLDGGLANGESFVLRLRETGRHSISIEVRDPYGGTCFDAVAVNVQ